MHIFFNDIFFYQVLQQVKLFIYLLQVDLKNYPKQLAIG